VNETEISRQLVALLGFPMSINDQRSSRERKGEKILHDSRTAGDSHIDKSKGQGANIPKAKWKCNILGGTSEKKTKVITFYPCWEAQKKIDKINSNGSDRPGFPTPPC